MKREIVRGREREDAGYIEHMIVRLRAFPDTNTIYTQSVPELNIETRNFFYK